MISSGLTASNGGAGLQVDLNDLQARIQGLERKINDDNARLGFSDKKAGKPPQ